MFNMFILVIFVIELALISCYVAGDGEDIRKWCVVFSLFVAVLIATINYNYNLAVENMTEVVVEDYYYAEAEIREVKENLDGTYDIKFIVIDSNGVTHFWKSEESMEDVPYLLTMNSNGTESVEDDEIAVVWKCVD